MPLSSSIDDGPGVGYRPSSRSSSSFSVRNGRASAFDHGHDDLEPITTTTTTTATYKAFVEDVVSFLDRDGVSHRAMSRLELRRVLERHRTFSDDYDDDHETMMTIFERDSFLVIGYDGVAKSSSSSSSSSSTTIGDGGDGQRRKRRHSFVLHMCPIPDLEAMRTSHTIIRHAHRRRVRRDDDDDENVEDIDDDDTSTMTTSRAVAAHAWLNARLTDAFSTSDDKDGDDDEYGEFPTSIVHLHLDVWRRSRSIVESRLRCKCGMYRIRYMARKMIVKSMTKMEYVPFLNKNHLWGSIGAKYAYGLYPREKNDGDGPIAVATFSSGRTITRANREYRSFELLRFCTAMDESVVGGLSRLISAFVRDVVGKRRIEGEVKGWDNMDIVTSIDRDFGRGDAWPNFASVEVMDPVPMFVGDIDGIRRHAIGAGLTPLEQPLGRRGIRTASDADDEDDCDSSRGTSSPSSSTKNASTGVLRAGLPESLLRELGKGRVLSASGGENAMGDDHDDRRDDPWRIAALRGFHPVFDAGVERLIMVVAEGGGAVENDEDDDRTEVGLSPSKLWDASTPRYVREHYSSNKGVQEMLGCIRSGKKCL